MKKRLTALVLALVLALQTVPTTAMTAYAFDGEETAVETVRTVEETAAVEQEAAPEAEAVKEETPAPAEQIPAETPREPEPEPEPVRVQPESIKFTIVVAGILQTNGTSKEATATSTLKQGTTQSKAYKWFENKVNAKSFSYNGTKYTFAGRFVDASGREVSFPMKLDPSQHYGDVTIVIYPVYDIIEAKHLSAQYIDNISTGSGSWYNVDEFTSYTHTFKTPDAQPHYTFVEWRSDSDGTAYAAGSKFSAGKSILDSTPDGGTLTVSFHAFWQPSVTVNYIVNGSTANSTERFDRIAVNGYVPAAEEGTKFIGWFDANGNNVTDAVYSAPAVTSDRSEQYIVNVYAKFTTSYAVEHALEGLDGTYRVKDTERFEDIVIGTGVSVSPRTYDGFTFDGNVESGTVAKGLVLTARYTRNSYTVSYTYDGQIVPEGAEDLLPQARQYKYEEAISAETAPEIAGYTFSGWDLDRTQMPSHDITVKGSWDYAPDALRYDANKGKGSMDETAGQTFNDVTVADNSFKRSGYRFNGWNTAADGSGTAYAAGDAYTLTTADDILYAQWKKIPVEIPADPTVPEVTVKPAPKAEEIPEITVEEDIPMAAPAEAVEIEEVAMPMAAPTSSWALMNLILMMFTGLLSLFTVFRKKDGEDEDGEDEKEHDDRMFTRILSLVPAIASIVTFILTENMKNPMVLMDRWTVAMRIMTIANVVIALMARNDDKEEKKERI